MSRNKPNPFEPKPKFSDEAEQAVIGALLLVPESYYKIADVIAEQDFHSKRHQTIWRAIAELRDRGHPPDAVTLGEWFEAAGVADLVGGSRYILELANTTPSAAGIKAYAEIVQRLAIMRRLEDTSVEISRLVDDPGDLTPQECLAKAQGMLLNTMPRDQRAIVTAKSAVKKSLEQMLARHQAALDGVTLFGLSTGIPELDELIGGLEPDLLYVLAGPPSSGKSMLAGWAVHYNSMSKKRTALFTIEMPAVGWTNRLIATKAGVNLKHIKYPTMMEDHEWPKITAAIEAIDTWDIQIDESTEQNIESMIARATQMHAEKPLDLIVIDHLGLVDVPEGDETYAIRVGWITRALKKLAKDLHVPVLLLCQMNKEGASGEPSISDLRDSGRIREDADVVLLIYRPNANEAYGDAVSKGYTEIIAAKARDGETNRVCVEAVLAKMALYPCARINLRSLSEQKSQSKVAGGFQKKYQK